MSDDDDDIGDNDIEDIHVYDGDKDPHNNDPSTFYDEYDGECGYWCVKLFKGKTVGRKLKRNILRCGLYHFVCSLALLLVGAKEGTVSYSRYVTENKFGMTLHNLDYLVGIIGFLFSIVCALGTKYWASLVTNRELLENLIRIFLTLSVMQFAFALWLLCVVFLTFKNVKSSEWNSSVEMVALYPCYVTTITFDLIYSISLMYYLLDNSYLLDEITYGGEIEEPEPPENAMDFSDVTITQTCALIFATPFILAIQLYDIVVAVLKYIFRYCKPFFEHEELSPEEEARKRKKRSFWHRLFRTCLHCGKAMKALFVPGSSEVRPVETIDNISFKLKEIARDKEEQERLERERIQEENLRRQQAERQKQQEQEEARKQKELEERKEQERIAKEQEEIRRQEAEAEAQRKREMEQQEEQKKLQSSPTLSLPQYKNLWTTLGSSGSFQCKLKVMPLLPAFTEHLRKQGFHVVFAVNPNPEDIEVGICNQRDQGQGPWFLARFLASNLNFSAVMKCEEPEQVTQFVKKFALAKILKIDTSK